MDDQITILAIVGLVILLGFGTIALLHRRSRAARERMPEELGPTPDQRPPLPAGPWLESADTSNGQRSFPLTKEKTLIGRTEDADIRIDESFANWETVSREHAWIERQENRVVVQDNNSTNGIAINGRRTRRNVLKDGWRLAVGGVILVFHAGNEEVSP